MRIYLINDIFFEDKNVYIIYLKKHEKRYIERAIYTKIAIWAIDIYTIYTIYTYAIQFKLYELVRWLPFLAIRDFNAQNLSSLHTG